MERVLVSQYHVSESLCCSLLSISTSSHHLPAHNIIIDFKCYAAQNILDFTKNIVDDGVTLSPSWRMIIKNLISSHSDNTSGGHVSWAESSFTWCFPIILQTTLSQQSSIIHCYFTGNVVITCSIVVTPSTGLVIKQRLKLPFFIGKCFNHLRYYMNYFYINWD